MDAFNPNYNNSDSGFKTSDTTENRSKVPTPGSFLGFFRAAQALPVNQASGVTSGTTPETSQASTGSYYEPSPVYKGNYENLCPLSFNTVPVDDATNTRLDRTKLAKYDRAQLFFLLRLERFLRLRKYWLDAKPRTDESWKTELAMRSIFSALRDCQKHKVGEDAARLLREWDCC